MIPSNFNQNSREKLGITEQKKHKIICTHCGKYLGSIIELNQPGNKQNNLCYCVCGNECFVIKTRNATSIFTEPQYQLVDMAIKNGITHIKLGKVK